MIIYVIAGLVSAILCFISSAYSYNMNKWLFLGFVIVASCELSGALVEFFVGGGSIVRMEALRIIGYGFLTYAMYIQYKKFKTIKTKLLNKYEPVTSTITNGGPRFSKSHIALNNLNKTLNNLKSYAQN